MVTAGPKRVHHIGITVRDVERSLGFWKAFLGTEPRWRRVLDAPYLSLITGYSGVSMNAAVIDLPGGQILELLDYRVDGKTPNPPDTANPGNIHICVETDDIDALWDKAAAAGAAPVSPGPVEITEGPNKGVKACYLRDPDGVTVELFQPVRQAPRPQAAGPAAETARD